MRNKYIENFENTQISEKNIPEFRAGDTVRLAVTIKEGEKCVRRKIAEINFKEE